MQSSVQSTQQSIGNVQQMSFAIVSDAKKTFPQNVMKKLGVVSTRGEKWEMLLT